MNPIIALRKVGYWLGITEETKMEYSETLKKEGVVLPKKHEEGQSNVASGMAMGNITWGIASSNRNRYTTKFLLEINGEDITFTSYNKEHFEGMEVDEKVCIYYREVHNVTRNYMPPDFDGKNKISEEFVRYDFIGAEKI